MYGDHFWWGPKTKDVEIHLRHQRASGIADAAVAAVSATQWRVRSQQQGRDGYDVYLQSAECPQNTCRVTQRCYSKNCGGLCEHMYWCTCPDDNTLCKHIHKVRMLSLGVRSGQTVVAQRTAAAATSAAPLRQVNLEVNADRQGIPVDQAGASSAAAGRGKRAQEAGSSGAAGEEEPASKQAKTAPALWCADCWAEAEDACGGHCLLAWAAAEEHAQASLAAAHQEATRQQKRLDALGAARAERSPVVSASVPHSEGNEDGWMVRGGSISIALAATEALTEADKAAVCAALEGLDMEYEMLEFKSVSAAGDVEDGALDRVLAKLPACVQGQTARKGAVLLRDGSTLEVHFRDAPLSGGRGVRLFGHVTQGLDDMRAVGCDGRSHGWYEQWGRYDGCASRSVDCYCREGIAQDVTLSDVQFEED